MVARNSRTMRLIGVAALGMVSVASSQASAQQILSAVEVEISGPNETTVRTTAGGVSTTTAGTDVRATTNYGVNKIYARGTASNDVYASSAWLDSFTVGGTGMVRLSFTFTVDGVVSGSNPSSAWNYQVAALRGDGWSLNGSGGWESTPYGRKLYTGDDYDTLILQRNANGIITRADARDFDGFYNYTDVGGQPGNFTSRAIRGVSNLGEYYQITSGGNVPGQNVLVQRLYATFFERSTNGGPFQQFGYDNVAAGGPQLLTAYNNVTANYSLLSVGGLCAGECTELTSSVGLIDPFTFTLDFDLLAGSKFSLASWLYADDVNDGTVDFFNTAKVTGVTVSAGGAITSASGALTALPGGGYGYAPAVSGVPEPATWAMMIMGFGLIGAAMRRRASSLAPAA